MRIYSARSGFASPIVIICCFMSEVKHNALSSKNELDALSGVVSQSPILEQETYPMNPSLASVIAKTHEFCPRLVATNPARITVIFGPIWPCTHTHTPQTHEPQPHTPETVRPWTKLWQSSKGLLTTADLSVLACAELRPSLCRV